MKFNLVRGHSNVEGNEVANEMAIGASTMDISREDTSDNPHLGFFLQIFRIDPTVEGREFYGSH